MRHLRIIVRYNRDECSMILNFVELSNVVSFNVKSDRHTTEVGLWSSIVFAIQRFVELRQLYFRRIIKLNLVRVWNSSSERLNSIGTKNCIVSMSLNFEIIKKIKWKTYEALKGVSFRHSSTLFILTKKEYSIDCIESNHRWYQLI